MVDIWMIRSGAFGWDSTTKLILTLVAIAICLYDWKRNDRKDYIWVFITGAIIWGGIELVQNLSGMRVMPSHVLFGVELPVWAGAILQGTSEGAYVAVIGLFVADRFFLKENFKEGVVGLAIMVVPSSLRLMFVGIQPYGIGIPSSERLMFTPIASIVLAIMVLSSVVWLVKTNATFRRRGIYMYIGMVILAVSFTTFEVLGGARWIGVGPASSIVPADVVISVGALSYDIFIEIAGAYVPFLVIPCVLGLIKLRKNKNQV